MQEPVMLAQTLKGWDRYQEHLTAALAPLTPEQLAFQIAPHLRSIMTLTAHIIAARVWWFHLLMHEGPADLRPLVKWDDEGAPARTAGELVQGLYRTWTVIHDGLARWTVADLADEFCYRWPGGDTAYTFTRQWIIWHVLEHDLHHGGELSFALGASGLPGLAL